MMRLGEGDEGKKKQKKGKDIWVQGSTKKCYCHKKDTLELIHSVLCCWWGFFFGGTLETVIKLGFIRIFFFCFLMWGRGWSHWGQKSFSQAEEATGMDIQRLTLHSQPDFFGNCGVEHSGWPRADSKLLKVSSTASVVEKSLFWLWLLLHVCARQAITVLTCWDCQELDEQEAVNRRTGASVQLANSLPCSTAARVPHRLPVQQLIPETEA